MMRATGTRLIADQLRRHDRARRNHIKRTAHDRAKGSAENAATYAADSAPPTILAHNGRWFDKELVNGRLIGRNLFPMIKLFSDNVTA